MFKLRKMTSKILGIAALLCIHSMSASALEKGVLLESLSADQGVRQYDTFEVPANASDLTIAMARGYGDADLYVRFGARPTLTDYDCRPYLTGNQESCTISNPQAGTYHVMLVAYRSYSRLTLLADYNLPLDRSVQGTEDNPIILSKGVAKGGLSGIEGESTYFMLPLTADARNLKVDITNGSGNGGLGDADLYVSYNQVPTTDNFDCRPYVSGSVESCLFDNAMAGNYYIMVRSFVAYSDVRLLVDYDDGSLPAPTPTPTPVPSPTPPVANDCITPIGQALLNAHNAARAQGRSCGGQYFSAAAPLQWSCKLGQAALNHTNDMATNGFMSHTGSNGLSPSDRIDYVNYSWQAWAENVAAGQSSVSEVVAGWLNSPGHCVNIMNSNLTEMGGAQVGSSNGPYSSYWTVDFGRPQ